MEYHEMATRIRRSHLRVCLTMALAFVTGPSLRAQSCPLALSAGTAGTHVGIATERAGGTSATMGELARLGPRRFVAASVAQRDFGYGARTYLGVPGRRIETDHQVASVTAGTVRRLRLRRALYDCRAIGIGIGFAYDHDGLPQRHERHRRVRADYALAAPVTVAGLRFVPMLGTGLTLGTERENSDDIVENPVLIRAPLLAALGVSLTDDLVVQARYLRPLIGRFAPALGVGVNLSFGAQRPLGLSVAR